ncbi:hypothetical protein [Endozoicomonas sp. SCSIO W0465]|nr:hypothetical protein [Endozoicomonas sp. SCSIO W0465]
MPETAVIKNSKNTVQWHYWLDIREGLADIFLWKYPGLELS